MNIVMNVVTLRVSAVIAALVQALRLHSVLGFVRPRHFRNVFHQDDPWFPRISVVFATGPTCALSVPCTDVLSLVTVSVPCTDP
ncbi:hypothetical protein PC123_g12667 [Phytophthora cactorum]|nr:hypothetical protein PC123_g12667 [Phytophthora cactorum]